MSVTPFDLPSYSLNPSSKMQKFVPQAFQPDIWDNMDTETSFNFDPIDTSGTGGGGFWENSGFGFNKGTADTLVGLAGLYSGWKTASAAEDRNRLYEIDMDRRNEFDLENLRNTRTLTQNEINRNRWNAAQMGATSEMADLSPSTVLDDQSIS
jgi:hypothetical protein